MNLDLHEHKQRPRSILVIRLSSLGDVVLTTPIVRQLQRSFPQAFVDVMVAERFSEVYAHNPRVRRIWSAMGSTTVDTDLDKRKLEILETVPQGKYDLVVDLQHSMQSAAIRRGMGNAVVIYPKFRWQKLAMVWLKRFPAITTSIVERYRMPLQEFPLVLDTEGPEVWLESERDQGYYAPRSQALPIHGAHHNDVPTQLSVAIAVGAHHATKRWPVEYFAQLCKMLVGQGARVMLIGGVADVALCDAVSARVDVAIERYDGVTSLAETIEVLDRADVLVTNDSGVMHLGAARRVPTVAIFGSTVRQLGFEPFGTRYVVVEHDVRCRPCSHIGRAKCPKGHFKCMIEIKPQTVFDAVRNLLGQ